MRRSEPGQRAPVQSRVPGPVAELESLTLKPHAMNEPTERPTASPTIHDKSVQHAG